MDDRFEEGRTAASESLAAALASAPASYIEGALANDRLGPVEMLVLLQNPVVTNRHIGRIVAVRRWMDAHEVRRAIALHPATPRHLAQQLLPHLRWRDLAAAADLPRLAPPLKRAAERHLALRLEGLALGERIALARIAGRGIIQVLRRDESPMVVRALLTNPRIVEEDVLALTAARSTPGPILEAIAVDGRFGVRPAVQRAIVAHRETPPTTALRVLRLLPGGTLKALSDNPRIPSLVRVAAGRLFEERRGAAQTGGGSAAKS